MLRSPEVGGVAWSPSGTQLAYISNASGRYNLWLMQSDGTRAHQLLLSNDLQENPIWTPDGKEIVFIQDKGGDEIFDLYAVSVVGGTPRNLTQTNDVTETNPQFSPDGRRLVFEAKRRDSPISDLAVIDWPNGKLRFLTHETNPDGSWSAAAWSPDGRSLYATHHNGTGDGGSDIFRVDAETGNVERITEATGNFGLYARAISPDGKTLLVVANRKGGPQNIALFDLDIRQLRWVTDTQWQIGAGQFSPRGDVFTYVVNADGRQSIIFRKTSTLEQISYNLPLGYNSPTGNPSPFRKDGAFLFSHQDSGHPSELWELPANGGAARQLTHNENLALQHANLPPARLVAYRSFDGSVVSAFVWIPSNLPRNGSAPAVLIAHGGPNDQMFDSYNPRAMTLLSHGYIVIAPNVRGSTGYGADFEHANYKDLGGNNLKDEIAGIDFLKATGFVDPKRVGIWGPSYGGFMALMAIGKTPDLWSAAVDEYGILDWNSMYQRNTGGHQLLEGFMGDPVRDAVAYKASSPITYIKNERAPLLVLQGDRDTRVPKEEAEDVVRLLKAEGKTVASVFYPAEGHGFDKREDKEDSLVRALAWFDKYMPRSPGNALQSNSGNQQMSSSRH